MTTTIKVFGVPKAMRAFEELPKRIGLKHLRIALNSGGGIVKTAYASAVRRRTGLLSKSIAVKVTIPNASFNSKHHGKPATAVIGVKRKAGRFMRINKQGNLKGFGAAQKFLVAERKRLGTEGKLPPLRREQAAVKAAVQKFGDAQYISPSRYAHLAGPRRRGADVVARVVSQTKAQVVAKITEKLTQGIESERASLVGG